uniref:Uncharacterized protein n=1 Tax=Anguilla anguilla TaxID=7936 RepID=A0A0E9SM63_ANGAN
MRMFSFLKNKMYKHSLLMSLIVYSNDDYS